MRSIYGPRLNGTRIKISILKNSTKKKKSKYLRFQAELIFGQTRRSVLIGRNNRALLQFTIRHRLENSIAKMFANSSCWKIYKTHKYVPSMANSLANCNNKKKCLVLGSWNRLFFTLCKISIDLAKSTIFFSPSRVYFIFFIEILFSVFEWMLKNTCVLQ